ncbi:9206_t:CDS:2, partial [Cetraspora pellucida]
WITKFKRHNKLRRVILHSEALSAPLETLSAESTKILSENSETNKSELGETELGESELSETELGKSELSETKLDKSELEVIKPNFFEINNINMLIGDLLANNEDIIKIVKHNFKDNSEVSDDNKLLPLLLVTVTKAVEALKKVIRYQKSLEAKKEFNENRLKILRKTFKK